MNNPLKNPQIRTLWKTVLGCAILVWIAYGLRFSTFNMLAVRITDDLGIARSAFTLSITFRFIAAFLISLVFGKLVARLGIPACLMIGLAATAIGEFIFSRGSSLPVFYLAGTVSGIGYALASNPLAVLIVNRRFDTGRGLIMGATSAVSGLGQALFNPVVGLLATSWGWRSVYLCSTVLVFVFGILIVMLLRADERYCDAGGCDLDIKSDAHAPGLTAREAARTPQFWFLLLTALFIGIAASGSYLIFPSHAQQDGLSLLFVTSVIGVSMPVGNIVGKLIFGASTDRLGAGRAALIPFGANLIGLIAALIMAPQYAIIAVVASVGIGFGISAPNLVPSLWVSDLFGRKDAATILGYVMAMVMVGSAAAMPLANLIFERAGSYDPALRLQAVLVGAILLMTLTVLRKKPAID